MTFDAESPERAEELVSGDPFFRERLLERHSIKEWITDTGPGRLSNEPMRFSARV
jgi:hypothetical protein